MKNVFLTLLSQALILAIVAQSYNPTADDAGNVRRGSSQKIPGENLWSEAGNPWVPVGPFGGDVVGMTVDPQNTMNLYAAAGLPFVSNNGGESWEMLIALAGISSNNVNSFAALTDGTIFGTGSYTFGKVFRSTNGGTAWHTRNIPVNSNGLCLATDPNDSSTVYVGLASNISSTTNKVVVKSSDAGNTWIAFDLTSVLPIGWNVIDICVDPDDTENIFAVANSGLSDARIVATFDGGTTWVSRSTNLPSGIPYNAVAIAGTKVFVAGGQLFGSQYIGLYQSDDYGISWTNISGNFPNKVANDILIDESDVNNMYVATEGDGIYYSTDGGTSWNFDATGAGENGAARCLAMKPGDPDQLYAGFLSLAMCQSSDAGLTWEFANNGIATLQVDDIEINPLDPQQVLVGFEAENSGGCYISDDGGDTWSLATGLPGTRFSQVTFGSDGTMYAWSNGPTTVAQEGLYKSFDGGNTWLNTGPFVGSLFETQIFALTVSPTDPNLIIIGGNNFGVNGWAPVIWMSVNGGQEWTNTYIGSPDDYYSIRFLFIDPNSNDQIIYAGYKSEVLGGFLKSTDGGVTWTEIGTSIPVTYKWGGAIVCCPDDPDKLLAGCGGYGNAGTICISHDGGSSWSITNLHMGSYSKVSDILIHPLYPEVAYCASTQNAVQISTNGGMTWTTASDGLAATNITGFSNPYVTGSSWFCYASTYTNSAFRTELFDPNVGLPEDVLNAEMHVYPNPSDGQINIQLPNGAEMQTVEVLSVSGQPLMRFDAGNSNPSFFSSAIDLPQGIYLLKVWLQDRIVVGKLIIRD
ncbi:MAG: T9SS type A sorting domain-containing protein [Bacteroidales bacterium]|nr:T9SS type A sorting domain-containing protein [Bacteroidales bacterium]